MTGRSDLESALADRVLVLDGAMGTQLIRRGFGGNLDRLTMTHPDAIAGVHHEYLAAGSDIVRTNTFNSAPFGPRGSGPASQTYALNVEGARLARAACDEWRSRAPGRPRFVAGAMGPTRRFVSRAAGSDDPRALRVSVDELADAFREQMRALMEGGCDLFLLETVCDPETARAAAAARNLLNTNGTAPPLLISVTLSGSPGRMRTGHTIGEFWELLAPGRPFGVGINCSEGPRRMAASLEELARKADCFVTCHPSAGLPGPTGDYPEGPVPFADALGESIDRGLVNIVGGCCGTEPEHVRKLVQKARTGRPRRPFSR